MELLSKCDWDVFENLTFKVRRTHADIQNDSCYHRGSKQECITAQENSHLQPGLTEFRVMTTDP